MPLSLQEYFAKSPSQRIALKDKYAIALRNPLTMLELLELSQNPEIQDAYDGAIVLLAECSESRLRTAIVNVSSYYFLASPSSITNWKRKLEILIKGFACASSVDSYKKLNVLNIFRKEHGKLTRLIKAAIIDALTILEDQGDTIEIREYLQFFTSEPEKDDYIRQYAQEALGDL